MLVIRAAQISALQVDVVSRFDRSLAEHLRDFAPRETKALENADVLSIVRLGRRRASEFGFFNRESIRLYLELMVLFGSGFSTDPQYPWAVHACPARGQTQDEPQRAGALHSNAIEYLHKVWGPQREFVLSALKRLLMHRISDFLDIGPFPGSLIEKLRVIFPQKYAYLGMDRMRTLIRFATAAAEQHRLTGPAAPVLFAVLMFLLGHEIDRDPVKPWVEAVLRDTAYMEPSLRVEKLENKVWEDLRDGMGRLT